MIKKVCCGSQFSLALTSTGLVSVSSHTKMTICAVYYSLLSMLILMKFSKTTWNNWWTVEAPLLQNTNMEAYYMPSAWLDCLVALLVVIIELLKVNIKLWKWKFGWSAELFCFELIVLFERAVGVALLSEESWDLGLTCSSWVLLAWLQGIHSFLNTVMLWKWKFGWSAELLWLHTSIWVNTSVWKSC